MKTLFPSWYNWPVFILTAFIIRATFIDLSMFSFIAVLVSLYQFSLLFGCIGHIIPTRHLLGSFMCIQFFIGPVLAYNGLDQYQYFRYQMRIPEIEYFGYVFPAVVLFITGLHLNAGKYRGEVVNQQRIALFVQKNPFLPYILIASGFMASIVSGYFGSELAFVFYLLGSFKFVGLFLLVFGTRQLKFWPMVFVIGSIILSSLNSGMFHDLLTWLIFSAAVFGIKYKFDFKIKAIGLSIFLFMAVTIQVLKTAYRQAAGREGGNVETFTNVYDKQSEAGGILNFSSLAQSNVRINQGFIITNIMTVVPDMVPFENGAEMYQIFQAAVMPRILAPNKLKAGDRSIFIKYSHIPLTVGTSMGLSSVGDAYINYGVMGGCIFMFLLGILYSEILNFFYKHSFDYPILILFVPLAFYYPIRPDCELQTILGHLFKSCFLVFVIIQVFKYKFRVSRAPARSVSQYSSLKGV